MLQNQKILVECYNPTTKQCEWLKGTFICKVAASDRCFRVNVRLDDGRELNEVAPECVKTALRGARVTYSDGTVIPTSLASHLTDEEILSYFKIGRLANIGTNEDNLQTIINCEIID